MPPILFLISAASSYRMLKQVAEHCVANGRRIVFLYDRGDGTLFEELRRDAAFLGGEVLAFDALVDPRHVSTPAWHRHPRRGHAMAMWLRSTYLLRGMTPRSVAGRVRELRHALAAQLAAARKLFRTRRPAAMVSVEDGISAPLAVHAAARQEGVRSIVVPFGYAVRRDLEMALDVKSARGEMVRANGPLAGLIRAHAPQWIKTGEHAGALMFEEAYIVAAESLGLTIPDPWIIHGGLADRLCVEGPYMQRVYEREGVPSDKMALTGSPYCDVMVRAAAAMQPARVAMRQPRRICPDRTRILVSWPPSYHDERGQFSEFASYAEMSVTVLRWLSSLNAVEVTVSLHPATLPRDRAAVESAGIRLSDTYVIDDIPKHDIFITYFSSVIRWAIVVGKPVVNLDLYKLGMNVYEDAPGVRTIATFAEFQQLVRELVSSDDAFTRAVEQQVAVADDWGILDGRCTARILEVIDGGSAAAVGP
jgi:hypothetical protein